MIYKQFQLPLNESLITGDLEIQFKTSIEIRCDYNQVLGLGERYNTLNHKGYLVVNKVEEQFCHQGDKTYFPLPFFILDNGYGFFLETKNVCEFNFLDIITISGDQLSQDRLYIFKGNYQEIISDFIKLTGMAKKAPKWTFGPWISAHRWNTQDMVDDVRKKLKKFDIPVTAMVLEQWSDEATFYIFRGASYSNKKILGYEDYNFASSPWHNPKLMIKQLHKDGIKLLLWQCPVVKHIPPEEPFNQRHQNEWDYVEKNKLCISGGEKPYRIPKGNWFNGSMIPDFTNPETIEWWFNNRRYLLDIGVDGFKTDGGEFIHEDVFSHNGETKDQLKNNYCLEYVKAYSEFLGEEGLAFSRAGYIGQQQYSLQWAGDQKSTFEELQSVYRAGISASICGQINWGFDIGGFSGELPSLELYYRANQLAVFTPIMQVHSEPVGGQFSATDPTRVFNNERTPWNMAQGNEQVFREIRELYNLRMNLLPYIYSEYLKALEQKTTLMKHMNVTYEGEFIDDSYEFGQLIVAPILHKEQSTLNIVLPEGHYYNIFTSKMVSGTISNQAIGLQDIFVWIKEGHALVTKEEELIPESIGNGLIYETLIFRVYGPKGSYRFVDEVNDFTIDWYEKKTTINGKITYKIKIIFVD